MPLARSPQARARWLVLAPHPDDETIGAGALIAQAASADRLAALVYLTDGSGSHPLADVTARARLIRGRAREGRLALHRLTGGRNVPVVALGWCDGMAPAVTTADHARTVRRVATLLRTARVDAVAVTAADETHGDHVAAYHLIRRAAADAHRRIAVFAYRVWGGAMPRNARVPLVTAAMPVGRRRHALMAHRSQTGAAFGPGFRIPAYLRRMRDRDLLYPERHRRAA